MAYDVTKKIKLQALKNLALRMRGENDKLDARITDLGKRVDQAAGGSEAALGSMYQAPTYAQYSTDGNMTASEAGDITDETLAALMGDGLGSDLSLTINNVTIGTYTGETKLSALLADINASEEAGVRVACSQTSPKFTFTAREAGAGRKIDLGEGLAATLFEVPALEDQGSKTLAGVYKGLQWMDDNDTATIRASIPGDSHLDFNVTVSTTIQWVVNTLNTSGMGMNHSFTCNKYTGRIEAANKKSGETVEFSMQDVTYPQFITDVEFNASNAPADPFTPGRNGVFTAIQVNGKALPVANKTVNIPVPTKVSALTNDSGFQTSEQVETAITGKGYQTAAQVESTVNAKVSSTYKAGGSVAFAALPALEEANLGLVVNVSGKFTTTADFVEGAGSKYPAGTNVAVVQAGETYKYDVLAGFVDLSGYDTAEQSDTKLAGKVDKVEGKVLSTNDYTDGEKAKLAGVAEGAAKVEASETAGCIRINGVDTQVVEIATDEEVQEMLDEVFGVSASEP